MSDEKTVIPPDMDAPVESEIRSEQAARARGKFAPGVSGNPGGRPGVSREVREAAQAYSLQAIETLAAIMLNYASRDLDRIAAADKILDRAIGKPAQAVELTGKDGGPLEHADKTPALTSEQRGRRIVELLNTVAALAGKEEAKATDETEGETKP